MIRSKTPKDEEISEENLIGKSIVDPNGHILAKCVGVFEDDKKKLRMKIAIKTQLDSDFVVKETIPAQSDEITDSSETGKQGTITETVPVEQANISKKQEVIKQASKKPSTKSGKKARIQHIEQFNDSFQTILEEKDNQIRNVRIVEFVKTLTTNKRFTKKAVQLLVAKMTEADLITRNITATILNHFSESSPLLLVPYFREGLESLYNEPSKDVEQLITSYLTKTATNANSNILQVNFQSFFDNLIIKRKICKNITRNRIHNLNLKIFVNNFYVQDILIYYYLKRIIKKKEDAQEFAQFLKNYNAIIIAYSLLTAFKQPEWKAFLDSPQLENTFEKPFTESIEKILEQFNNGNIKEISDIVDPKLGYQFSNQIIQKMIKLQINDVLAQVSILPLDILSSFFYDDDNRTIQIIYELINKQEIAAQIVFIDGKTFISPRDK